MSLFLYVYFYLNHLSCQRGFASGKCLYNSNSDSVLSWLASPIWITPHQGRWGRGRPPGWQGRHGPHERRVVGAFSGARAACGALYCGPLVCRAGPAVILMSIHGSVVPTEVIEEIGRHWVGAPAWQDQHAGREISMEIKIKSVAIPKCLSGACWPHMHGVNQHTCVYLFYFIFLHNLMMIW